MTDVVLDGAQSIALEQAENRLHLQKALMVKLVGAGVRGRAATGVKVAVA